MNPIIAAATQLQEFVLRQEWECFIGDIADFRWGELRTTQDVVASMFVPAGTESEVVQTLLSEFNPRIPDAAEFAMKSRVEANADIDRETVANR